LRRHIKHSRQYDHISKHRKFVWFLEMWSNTVFVFYLLYVTIGRPHFISSHPISSHRIAFFWRRRSRPSNVLSLSHISAVSRRLSKLRSIYFPLAVLFWTFTVNCQLCNDGFFCIFLFFLCEIRLKQGGSLARKRPWHSPVSSLSQAFSSLG